MMKKNLLTATMALITFCSVTSVKASTFPIVESKLYNDYAINSRGVLSEIGLRTYMGRYMIVVGYNVDAQPGDYVDITLSNKQALSCVVLDKLGLADVNGAQDISFVVDSDRASADIRRYNTVSVHDKFAGDVTDVHVYTADDYTDIQFERVAYNADVQSKRLVTKKRVVEVAGKRFFFVYYSDNGNCNVKQVTEEEYNLVRVDWSVVDV